MEIIVADANIFVYFFLCGLLPKFLSNHEYVIKITEAVRMEITDKSKRIAREYPNLREFVQSVIFNDHSDGKLEVININERIQTPEALARYYELEEAGELDAGETESIPLALELEAHFLSNDHGALLIANQIVSGLGLPFSTFYQAMLEKDIITNDEYQTLKNFMENY